jgi:hypothetical protein
MIPTQSLRNLGGKEEVDREVAIYFLEDREWDLQGAAFKVFPGNVVPSLKDSKIRGNDLDSPIGPLSQNCVKILIDGRTEYGATELFVVRRQVCSPAAETNPPSTANYEHLRLSSNTAPAVASVLTCGEEDAFGGFSVKGRNTSVDNVCKSKKYRETVSSARCTVDHTAFCLQTGSGREARELEPAQ